jgi:hypothetical protein
VTGNCSNNCPRPEVFPRSIDNRPGLSRIGFRIGTYADFREALFNALDRSPLLLPWTHRQPDDPGIALLEGVAILGDILTFYQELYANEAWLRTATWPESVTGLVRLLGYRPAPGIGGEASAAFEFKGATPVTVAAGFGFNAQLVGQKQPVDFETAAGLTAVPQLSRFSLYAPWHTYAIGAGTSVLSVDTGVLAAVGVTLKPKDRLALLDLATVANAESVNWQIAVVGSVAVVLDQTVITLNGSWQQNPPTGGTLMAYKLGRGFHAFGYNAPTNSLSINNNVATSTPVDTTIALPRILDAFPLDRKVDDLSAGTNMLVDLQIKNRAGQTEEFLLTATAYRTFLGADSVGPMSGSVTKVELQTSHVRTGNVVNADRRTAQCLEVVGSPFQVAAQRLPAYSGPGVDTLYYYGDGAGYQQLDGRTLQFVVLNADDSVARLEQSTAAIDSSQTGDLAAVELRSITLNPALQQFNWEDFLLKAPTVTVLGNVVPVTQGKTQRQATLGNGDARQVNQTFMVPKGPLTWLGDEALTPPRIPQLHVLVNNIEWDEVDSLFAAGSNDTSYIIRQDENGNSWVQFGDGVNGSRLPSGVGNVLITYRTGVGANGDRTPGTKPQPVGQAQNLSAIRLYNTVTGGAAPESSDSARQTAPGRVQSLGRLVSLSDFEYEALALPGVEKAQATWDLSGGVPLLVLTVLLANPSDAATESVQAAMSLANIARGPQRFQVQVQPASLQYVFLNLTFGLTRGYQPHSVIAAIQAALGVILASGPAPSGGLFSLDQRQLGQPEYATRIEGVVQNVAGVDWVEVTAFRRAGLVIDFLPRKGHFRLGRPDHVPCAPNQVLALDAAQFTPSPSTAAKGAGA